MTRSLLIAPVLVLLIACGTPGLFLPGNNETDRIADVVSVAISWPRQDSAMDYARAAAATTAGRDGRLAVVGVEELEAEELEEAFAELTFRIHLEGSTSGWSDTDPVTACYRAEFNFWGVINSPHRTRCSPDAVPVEIPPLPPAAPGPEVAPGSDRIVRAKLAALAARPDAAALHAALERRLPVIEGELPPEVGVVVDGVDIGVALSGGGADCVLGARIDGQVQVWAPSRVQLQPGELTCDEYTALAQWGQQAPH